MIAHTSSVRLPNPGTNAVAVVPWKDKSVTLYKPSVMDFVTSTPSKPATSVVSLIVSGAGEAPPGVNLNERIPHASV